MYQELASQIYGRTLEFRQAGISGEELKEQLEKIEKHLREDFTNTDWDGPGLKEMRNRLTYLIKEARHQVKIVYEGETYGVCGTIIRNIS